MALSLVLALTLVLALVRNILIFSEVRVLVLNQPIKHRVVWGVFGVFLGFLWVLFWGVIWVILGVYFPIYF